MTLIAQTRYGAMECLRGDSVVSQSLARYGEWAQIELDLLAALVRPGMTVLDVGAFLGTHTLALAAMVGSQGMVHSFEPRAGIREILSRNVERNGLGQVRVHACALGAISASLEVTAIDLHGEANFGGLALEGQDTAGGAACETIAIERLDDLAIGRVDFAKLDAEGMEADVLAGATRTLSQHRPVLFSECNDLERGRRTFAACTGLDYVVHGVLSPAFNPDNLRGDSENIFGDASEASLLAVPREKQHLLTGLGKLAGSLAPITTLDDLALLLLHKAQYPVEVLAQCPAAAVLGMDYLSPMARRQRDKITELELATRIAYERAQEAERRADLAVRGQAAIEAAVAHLQQAQGNALRYRRTSLAYWAERLGHRLRGEAA